MSFFDRQGISQTQYFEELQHIILSVPQCSIKQYLEQKQMFGKDISLFQQEVEYLKQSETAISQLKDIALYLGNKVVEVRKQHYDEIEYLEAEIMQAKEEIQEQKQKLQEYYQIYQSMEEKNIQYQKQNFELEEQCDKYLSKLTTLYQTMEAVEQQRIQTWNLSKKNAQLSINMFSNDIDPQNNNYPTMSLQNIGQTSQEQEQPTVCPSCTEKQFMIQQLQEEVNSINTEKYSLKEKLFILKGQMEVLKKRNGELEKTNDNINIMEKYSKIQKQRIKIQKGKGQFQTHHFYSTERALSPNSSVCNTVEDDQISHSQNGNYQYLLDELNQIKLRSMNHHPLSEIFSDTRRRSSPFNLHHFADFQEASHQDMQSFSEYCKTNNNIDYQLKQKNGETVSQFIVDPNSQVKTFNQISFPISNPKQIQSETNSPLEQTQNKQSKPLVFSQIFQQNELVKQNSKENEIAQIQSGTKKKRSSQEKKNFYKHTRHHDYQKQTQINFSSNDQPQYIQVNSIDEDTENNIDSLDNLQRTESSIQNDITVKDQNNGNKSLLGITNTSGVQQSLSELKIKYQHSKKKSELKIQQPLFEDLKCLMSIKDQFVQSFNITSSKLSNGEKENCNQEKIQTDYEEEEEKKDYDQNIQEQNYSESNVLLRSVSDINLTQEDIDQRDSQMQSQNSIEEMDQISQRQVQSNDRAEEDSEQYKQKIIKYSKQAESEEQIQDNEEQQQQQQQQQLQQNTQTCIIIPLPPIKRGLIYKLISWMVFLLLIPLSFFVNKPSFLQQQHQRQ